MLPRGSMPVVAPQFHLPVDAGSRATTWLQGHPHSVFRHVI
jgi:hypothetical protein